MTQEALIRQLQISCLGLDRIDPLRLLVDDVIAALAQPELCKYGQEPKSCTSSPMDCQCAIDAALAQPEQDHIPDARKMVIEQEPVKYSDYEPDGVHHNKPPQRTWVGLTDEEIAQGCKESWVTEQAWQSAVWWAEDKLKEKNT